MKRLALLGVVVAFVGAGQVRALASVVVLDHATRGWYDDTGGNNGNAPTKNYFAGQNVPPNNKVFHNYFVFDLSSIEGTVVAAALVLDTADYISADPTEEYLLRHVSTPVSDLGTVDSLSIFGDLADGSLYGSRVYSDTDDRVVHTIVLNSSAIADLNGAIGGDFALGGHISTLSGQTATFEAVFADSQSDAVSRLQLEIQPIPEPSTLAIWSLLGLCGIGYARRRRRNKA